MASIETSEKKQKAEMFVGKRLIDIIQAYFQGVALVVYTLCA